jgi:RNA polymerase sigma-70 factor (ECF subfamily)
MNDSRIEALAARSAWLRALARQLCADGADADDVAQDAAVAALRVPAGVRDERAWLAGVVHNLVHGLRRTAARRTRRESAAARREAQPSAADAVALVEQQRLLAEVVLGLDEPFRDVVLLRFYEALPRRAIARRLGVPVATVNSRLTRALHKLRERLDQRHGGDRSRWVAAFAPLCWRASTPGSLTLGALAMKKKILAAAVLVVALSTGWWVVGPGTSTASIRPNAPVPVAAGRVDTRPPEPPVAADEVAERTPVDAAQHAGIEVRILDRATGARVPTAEVAVLEPERDAAALRAAQHDVALLRRSRLDAMFAIARRVPVDADGAAWLPDDTERAFVLARADGRLGQLRIDRKPSSGALELELWPVRAVRVRVDDRLGRPAARVPVALRCREFEPRIPLDVVATGADGIAAFCWFDGMADAFGTPRRFEVAFAFPGGGAGAVPLATDGEDLGEVRLRLPPVGTLRVVAPAAADGRLTLAFEAGSQERDGELAAEFAAGRAELWPVAVGQRVRVLVALRDGQPPRTADGDGPSVEHGVAEIALAAGVSCEVVGRLVNADGTPHPAEVLTARFRSGGAGAWLTAECHRDGRFRVVHVDDADAALPTALELQLGAAAGPIELELALPPTLGERIDLGDVVVPARPLLARGVVVDEAGQPIAGATIQVVLATDAAADRSWRSRGPGGCADRPCGGARRSGSSAASHSPPAARTALGSTPAPRGAGPTRCAMRRPTLLGSRSGECARRIDAPGCRFRSVQGPPSREAPARRSRRARAASLPSRDPSGLPPIASQVGQKIEILVPSTHLETDPCGVVGLTDQDAVSQNAVNEVDWCGVDHYDLGLASESSLQFALDVEGIREQVRCRRFGEQDRHVHIAARSGRAARDAAIDPRRANTVGWRRKVGLDVVEDSGARFGTHTARIVGVRPRQDAGSLPPIRVEHSGALACLGEGGWIPGRVSAAANVQQARRGAVARCDEPAAARRVHGASRPSALDRGRSTAGQRERIRDRADRRAGSPD